jgi:HK97 family phage prohead protease
MSAMESQPETLERQPAPDQVIRREAALVGLEFRDGGEATGDGSMTLMGHAAVFGRLSLPLYDRSLGEFQERIARGAFDNVLNRNPDVHLVVAHDMSKVLARTQSKTLELREDPAGLRVFARIDPGISFANDLRIQMQRGDVDQMSFAFTVADESVLIENPDTPDQRTIRTIHEIGELFDVSVVAQGAYQQTDANIRELLERAAERGCLAVRATDLPSRFTPKVEGQQEGRDDPKSSGVTQARAHRLEVMRQRLALITQAQEKQ